MNAAASKHACCCLGIAPRAQLLKKSTWLLHLIDDKALPAARDRSEVARALNRRCYPHTGNGGHSWYLSSGLSLPVRFFTQDEGMDIARTHYHVDFIYLLP